MFLFSSGYQDVATLSKTLFCSEVRMFLTCFLKVAFLVTRQGRHTSIRHSMLLARKTQSSLLTNLDKCWLALSDSKQLFVSELHEVRIRVKRCGNKLIQSNRSGLRMTSFNGNFFVRSTDLLSLASVPVDQTYTMEIVLEENLTVPFVVFQTGVLHTSCFGERRIRVVTIAIPTTSSISEVYASVDQNALATILCQRAVERSISHKLEDARDAVTNKLIDIMTAYRNAMTAGGAGAASQLAIADNMKMLPVLMLGLLKNTAIRASSTIPSDLRAYAQALLTSLPPQMIIPYIHPNFYALVDMAPEAGTVGEHGIIMPVPMPLTSERLVRHGLFMMEDGQSIFLWLGRDAVPQLVQDVFGVERYDQLQSGKVCYYFCFVPGLA